MGGAVRVAEEGVGGERAVVGADAPVAGVVEEAAVAEVEARGRTLPPSGVARFEAPWRAAPRRA